MTERGFEPLTGQLGIPGTSYRLQLGLINEKWAVRLLRGRDVLDSYVFKDEDSSGGFPNQNLIVGYVLRTVAIPNINPHQVMKTTQALVKQAMQKKEERKIKAPLSETKEVELKKVPESEIKRPKPQGWVKNDNVKSEQELLDEKRQAFKQRVAAQKETEIGRSSGISTVKTSRQLPSIPSGGSPQESPGQSHPSTGGSNFCPHCGEGISWKFCPHCGEKLPNPDL
ncbi:hypothetical protein LCGC14_2426000 [marine sediment metagenome]|uniref:Zinc-ribbon domain-containing protein n=1 Tax=marine sediment metagenome TaxID=412755 RepID=A0A0F9BND4_9ZZZZ